MEPIITAGQDFAAPEADSPRRTLIKGIRAVLRRVDATEAEDLDALEALVELSKE